MGIQTESSTGLECGWGGGAVAVTDHGLETPPKALAAAEFPQRTRGEADLFPVHSNQMDAAGLGSQCPNMRLRLSHLNIFIPHNHYSTAPSPQAD